MICIGHLYIIFVLYLIYRIMKYNYFLNSVPLCLLLRFVWRMEKINVILLKYWERKQNNVSFMCAVKRKWMFILHLNTFYTNVIWYILNQFYVELLVWHYMFALSLSLSLSLCMYVFVCLPLSLSEFLCRSFIPIIYIHPRIIFLFSTATDCIGVI